MCVLFQAMNEFDSWNDEKKQIHNKNIEENFFVNKREVWFVKMGINIGFEERCLYRPRLF